MEEGERWTGEVIGGAMVGYHVDVRSHGFPVEMYVVGVGSQAGTPPCVLALATETQGLSRTLEAMDLIIRWDGNRSPLPVGACPGAGRRSTRSRSAARALTAHVVRARASGELTVTVHEI